MSDIIKILHNRIYPYLSPAITEKLNSVPDETLVHIMEIRIRINKPLLLVLAKADCFISSNTGLTDKPEKAYMCTKEDLSHSIQLMSRHSVYAIETELNQGFITLKGGHRVGLAGQAILDNSRLKALQNISSLNIRINKEIIGCANFIIPYLISENAIMNSLIISPPRCGKTTLLRDIARQISCGIPRLQLCGKQIGIVDERSEIGACIDGIPSVDLGLRTDVLDGCPKAQGMLMLIRSMSPEVIITDELGRQEDTTAICEALHAGVSVVASAHGSTLHDAYNRPYLNDLIKNQYFDRIVVLSCQPNPGTVTEIFGKNQEILYSLKGAVQRCG